MHFTIQIRCLVVLYIATLRSVLVTVNMCLCVVGILGNSYPITGTAGLRPLPYNVQHGGVVSVGKSGNRSFGVPLETEPFSCISATDAQHEITDRVSVE